MATHINAESNDTHILTLAQWFSPAFPVGGFHFSHGLEYSIDSGAVRDKATLRDWVRDVLVNGSGASDALFLNAAFGAKSSANLQEIDQTARAFAASGERLRESLDMGGAFARITSHLLGQDFAPACYPVVVGYGAQKAGLPPLLTTKMYLQAFVTNLASVGMRLIPLGHSDGQALIQELLPTCETVAEAALDGDLSRLSSTSFLSDIAAMRHETQHSRIFRT